MKFKALILMSILILLVSPLISSEMSLWNSVIKDTDNSLVKQHLYYWFDDTSANGVGRSKVIPIYLLYNVQALPFNLTGGEVDWCNLTISHFVNEYVENNGLYSYVVNHTHTDVSSYYFDSGADSDMLEFDMKANDVLIADMTCHYTDVNYLYEQNLLIGSITTYTPSFECKGCTQYTLEELSNQIAQQENITQNELAVYTSIQSGVNWNFEIWLIISWIVKIGFIVVGLFLIFAGAYYLYKFLENLGREI